MSRCSRYGLALLALALPLQAADKLAQPESLGFSSAGLKAYEQALHALVDEGKLAGSVTLVARHGKPVAFARGSYYWGGAYGTWFWIDPANDLIVVGMIQNLNGSVPTGGTPPVRSISQKLVYEALRDPKL